MDKKICAICRDEVPEKEAANLPCKKHHAFHIDCISQVRKPECPVCRGPLGNKLEALDDIEAREKKDADDREEANRQAAARMQQQQVLAQAQMLLLQAAMGGGNGPVVIPNNGGLIIMGQGPPPPFIQQLLDMQNGGDDDDPPPLVNVGPPPPQRHPDMDEGERMAMVESIQLLFTAGLDEDEIHARCHEIRPLTNCDEIDELIGFFR
jgi:hypothetical protein